MRANELLGTAGEHTAHIADDGLGAPALSAVSWSAVLAGAAGAAALSLILLLLGVGLGLSSVSPWSGQGAAAATLGAATIAWLAFMQLAASGLGGYLAGRLRHRWSRTPADEVYFRDTAHGFLAWAVATLLTAATLTTAMGSIAGNAAEAGAPLAATTAAATAAGTAAVSDTGGMQGAVATAAGARGSSSMTDSAYDVDRLFRVDTSAAAAAASAPAPTDATATGAGQARSTAEVARIIARGHASGALPADDVKYLGQLVAQRTGLTQADAEARVSDGFNKLQARLNAAETSAREAADKARKASAHATLWMFISLLIGAFVASLAATYGGHRRDLA